MPKFTLPPIELKDARYCNGCPALEQSYKRFKFKAMCRQTGKQINLDGFNWWRDTFCPLIQSKPETQEEGK